MSTILVTGGAGFIGTHLCRELIKRGNRVRSLDLQNPKTAVEGVEYVIGDIRDRADLAKMLQGVDAVYHYAAIVSVPVCQQKPLEGYSTNLHGTVCVLEAVRQESENTKKPIKLFFAGSSVVYGNLTQKGEKRSEDSQLAWPPSFYGAQKLGSEHAISQYHQLFKIPALVFRFFNVYGPGQDPSSPYSGVISIFSDCALKGKPLRLNAGGPQTRDFISVHDLVSACANALDLPESELKAQAVNLGTGEFVTIKELANLVCEASKTKLPIETAPAREGDVMYSCANNDRARALLALRVKVSLKDGLKELLAR